VEQNEVLNHIRRITWGKKIVTVLDSDNKDRHIIIRYLSPPEIYKSDNIYNMEYARCLNGGLATQEQLLNVAVRRGLWSHQSDKRLEQLRQGINNLRESINPLSGILRNNKIKKHTAKMKLLKYEKEYDKLLKKKDAVTFVSAENRANHEKFLYMASAFTETLNEKPIWSECYDILEEDVPFVYRLIEAYYVQGALSIPQIRGIARHPAWRSIWDAAKNRDALFGLSTSHYTDEQAALAYWTQVYEGIEQHTERPPKHVIDDDELLDKWLEEQTKKEEKESKLRKYSSERFKGGEVFIFAESMEEVESIQSMNSSPIRQKIANEQAMIEKKGSLSEFELRKKDIILQARQEQHEKNKQAKAGRGKGRYL
jgi:hypothetical protein